MLQQDRADDYVIATGRTTSIQDLCTIAFGYAGLDPADHVKTRSDLIRPAEVDVLLGDATKARTTLGWTPDTSLEAMVGRDGRGRPCPAPRPHGELREAARNAPPHPRHRGCGFRRAPISCPLLHRRSPPRRSCPAGSTCATTPPSRPRLRRTRPMRASTWPPSRRCPRRSRARTRPGRSTSRAASPWPRSLLASAPGCTLLYVSTADAYGRSFRGGDPVSEATALGTHEHLRRHEGRL